MSNLTESSSYSAAIYQLETSDPVLGGPGGIDNLQAQQLANRTRWLKDQVDDLQGVKNKQPPVFSSITNYVAGEVVSYNKNLYRANSSITAGAFNASQWTKILGTAAEADQGNATPLMDGTAAAGASTGLARDDHRHPTDTSRAPLASPALTGNPTAPTPSRLTDSTALATTAFVRDVGLNSAGAQTAAKTYTADELAGKLLIMLSANGTYTLPSLSSMPFGAIIKVISEGDGNIIACQGADKLLVATVAGAVPSLTLNTGDTLEVHASNDFYHCTGGSAQLRYASDFSRTLELLDFTGMVAPFAMDSPPAGWLKCNGQAVSRTTYARLFAKIGTLYGAGNGTTTFNVPECRAEFIRGWDDERNIDNEAPRTCGSWQGSANISHTHTASSSSGGNHSHTASSNTTGGHTHSGTTSQTGSHSHGGSTSWVGDHYHTGNTNTTGAHTHSLPRDNMANYSGDTWALMTSDNTDESLSTNPSSGSAGDHSHSFNTSSAGGHSHSVTTDSQGNHSHTYTTDSQGSHSHTITVNAGGDHTHPVTVNASGGSESRPRNVAMLYCIKY